MGVSEEVGIPKPFWPCQIYCLSLCFLEGRGGARDVSDREKRWLCLESQFGNHCKCRAHPDRGMICKNGSGFLEKLSTWPVRNNRKMGKLKVKGQVQGHNAHGCQADLEAGVSYHHYIEESLRECKWEEVTRMPSRGTGEWLCDSAFPVPGPWLALSPFLWLCTELELLWGQGWFPATATCLDLK